MVRTKVKTEYGLKTVGELIEALKQYVEGNDYLDMNSPVFISDYNMSGYKHEFDVLPTFSPYLKKAGLCFFHSLNEPVAEESKYEPIEELEEEEVTYDLSEETFEEKPQKIGMTRFMEWYKN